MRVQSTQMRIVSSSMLYSHTVARETVAREGFYHTFELTIVSSYVLRYKPRADLNKHYGVYSH